MALSFSLAKKNSLHRPNNEQIKRMLVAFFPLRDNSIKIVLQVICKT
jgi:hypothetical protein